MASLVERLRHGPLSPALNVPTPYDPRNDEHLECLAGQLLQQFRTHDDVEAFTALVELTQLRLFQVASGVARRLALVIEPEDLVASFMARLFTDVRKHKLQTQAPVRRFLALAYTMMRFDALNQLRLMRRARARAIRYEEREAPQRHTVDPAWSAEVRERSGPLPRLGTLMLAVVGRCFHGLKVRDRRILICRELESLSYDQIALVMELPRSQVGMVLKRARERLLLAIDRSIPAHPSVSAAASPTRAHFQPSHDPGARSKELTR